MATGLDEKTLVGFSLGDPGGIGPQLLLKFLEEGSWKAEFIPIVYAPRRLIEQWRSFLNLSQMKYHLISAAAEAKPETLNVVDITAPGEVRLGTASAENGAVARLSLIRAVEEAQTGNLDLLVTLPVDKATLYEAQAFPFRGHTEYFRHLYPGRPLMLMVGEYLRVALVTEHLPLCEVVTRLSPEQVEAAVQQLAETLQIDFGIAGPRIAVLALNPHAGDGGLIGTEEERWLKPLVQRLSDTITVGGPYSADGFFGARLFHGVDGVLALYHDQGLIPFKLLEGWQGYQVTAGLPFIRTAPDHGVAYDKVGQAEVSIASLSAAVWEGLAIARRRHNTLLYMRPQVSRP